MFLSGNRYSDDDTKCQSSTDCKDDEICVTGSCKPRTEDKAEASDDEEDDDPKDNDNEEESDQGLGVISSETLTPSTD